MTLYGAARHDSGNVATKAHDHRYERLAVYAHAVHDLIHDKCGTCQVSRILQEGDKEVENHDVGQEDKNTTHTADNAIGKHIAQRTFAHRALHRIVEPIYAHLDPLLRIGSEREGAVEHKPHQGEKYGKSPETMRNDSIYLVAYRIAFALRRCVGLLQGSRYKAIFMVCQSRLDILA